MNVRTLVVVIFAFFCTQCSNKKESYIDNTIGYNFEKQEKLIFSEMSYPELLGGTMQIIKVDSFLLLNDFHGDSLIHLFNLKSGQLERKLVAVGNGPSELISPLELQLVDDNLWVLCRPLHLLNHISCSDFARNNILSKDGVVKPESDCFIPLGNKQIVFSGFWNKRYALMDIGNTEEIKEFGDYPDFWDEEKNIPISAKAMFHQSRFAINTSKNLFAVCSYFSLEIFQYDELGKKMPELKYRKQLGKYEYDFETGGRNTATMRQGADPASVDIVSGGQFLYILIQDEEHRKNRNIMVLDWEGNPVKLLKSGKRITCLTIDEKEGKGYCIIQDPEDKIVSFKL